MAARMARCLDNPSEADHMINTLKLCKQWLMESVLESFLQFSSATT